MRDLLDMPANLLPVAEFLGRAMGRVTARFDEQLASDLPPVNQLCAHVERYRGKMLRPTLVLLCGLAAKARGGGSDVAEMELAIGEDHITAAAVCEMVHMATLVHDDVLDEADTRRRGETINRLRGNEAAVILGDYLIASAYHLCSQIKHGGNRSALAVGRASMVLCAGELLQLHHRDNYSLDERTYFEIVDRKTAELIATACDLGAFHAGADEEMCKRLGDFGRRLGIAFQIQDDLLDLMGTEASVGKSVGKDLEKGKMTLPLVHHLANADAMTRGRTLALIESAGGHEMGGSAGSLRAALETTGSIRYASATATRLVREAKALLHVLADSPAKSVLLLMADAVVERTY